MRNIMLSIEKIGSELKGMGYAPFFIDTAQGRTAVIDYCIPVGKHAGEKVLLGFSFQEEGYPEYPPHWIHISPPYDDLLGGSTQLYNETDKEGIIRKWLALSRPPGSLWDNLPTKHMKSYIELHVLRFCKNLK